MNKILFIKRVMCIDTFLSRIITLYVKFGTGYFIQKNGVPLWNLVILLLHHTINIMYTRFNQFDIFK